MRDSERPRWVQFAQGKRRASTIVALDSSGRLWSGMWEGFEARITWQPVREDFVDIDTRPLAIGASHDTRRK